MKLIHPLGIITLINLISATNQQEQQQQEQQVFSNDFGNLSKVVNQSLLWGTYRPNLYFGMRARLPNSLLTGLMWFGAHDYVSQNKIRHACDQGDGLTSYTFTEHDGRNAAVQIIKDLENNVEIKTELLKIPGGNHGGSWGVRVSGKPMVAGRISRISVMNYFGNDGSLGSLEMETDEDEEGIEGEVQLKGRAHGLGDYTIRIVDNPNNSEPKRGPHSERTGDQVARFSYFGAPVPAGQIWKAKSIFAAAYPSQAERQAVVNEYGSETDPALLFKLPNEIRSGASLFGYQKVYDGIWSFDLFYDSLDVPGVKLDAATLTAGLAASSLSYASRFDQTFSLSSLFSSSEIAFAQAMTSNLIGGIGYFYGSSIVDRNFAHEWDDEDEYEGGIGKSSKPELTIERELFTATPSRSFFPRGFYWDEGFHLLLIGAWDNDLSLTIIKDWINLIDEDGWVAREQILGEEARSKVPQEFQTQYPTYANPPTLAMAVTAYIDRLKRSGISLSSADPTSSTFSSSSIDSSSSAESLASLHVKDVQLARTFLTSIYPKLKLHYEWFTTSQRGQVREWGRECKSRKHAYRWRGRTEDHVLTSGLDDYPRAKPPHLGELHVDLISWMGFFSHTLSQIAEFLGEEDDLSEFKENYENIVANLDDLHWSEEEQMYCDASVDGNDESIHVCHKGYISLFPFLLGLLKPDSDHLGPMLDLIRDPKHLWSPYGIRSLSLQHPLFGQGENYWRGPIWIQMNYMALSSLYKIYAKESGPHQVRAAEIYAELRTNVIKNVYKEYERTGFVWEQYEPVTGEGKRSHPFTGWTSLVTLIMAEQY